MVRQVHPFVRDESLQRYCDDDLPTRIRRGGLDDSLVGPQAESKAPVLHGGGTISQFASIVAARPRRPHRTFVKPSIFEAPLKQTRRRPELSRRLDGPFAGHAGFWKRVLAFVIDSVVLIIPLVACVVVGQRLLDSFGQNAVLLFSIVPVVGIWLYHALLESSSWQGAIGKNAVGIKVTDMRGERVSFGHASGRCFAKGLFVYLAAVALYVDPWAAVAILTLGSLMGVLIMAWTPRKQSLFDMVSGTLVANHSIWKPLAHNAPNPFA